MGQCIRETLYIRENAAMQVNTAQVNKINVFKRLFGKCLTQPPQDPGCWQVEGGKVTVDLARAPELASPDGAIRLENESLPKRVLLMRGDDGELHAFHNSCSHGKRRLDPVPGAGTVQCCSMGHTTYGYDGSVLTNDQLSPVTVFEVEQADGKVMVTLL